MHQWTGSAQMVLVAITLLLFPALSQALFIDPVRMEITAPPGTSYAGQITLRNDQPGPLAVEIGRRESEEPTTNWLQVSTGIKTLSPEQEVSIPFTVQVPTSAQGELKSAIFFSEAAGSSAGESISIKTRISVPIYLIVKGTERYAGVIRSAQVKSWAPLKVSLVFENQGNVHLRPQGALTVSQSSNGEKVAEAPINPLGYPVFPGAPDELSARNDQLFLPAGRYQFQAEIPVDGQTIQYRWESSWP